MIALSSPKPVPTLSLAVPAALALTLSVVLLAELGMFNPAAPEGLARMPELVTIAPATFRHRVDGEFYRRGFAVDAPEETIAMTAPLSIMKYQVSADEYDACTRAGACPPREPHHAPQAAAGELVPATGTSHDDALAYAKWLSLQTGDSFSLPSDAEWAFAAGDAFVDDALGIDPDSKNPALRWLADYNRETARKASSDPAPKALGHYGLNEHGVADMAGNVWEWTSTCQRRVDLDRIGTRKAEDVACGIFVVEGKHRSPMSSFVRDPKTGGCSVGAPPDNLGFRLVRRPGFIERMRRMIGI